MANAKSSEIAATVPQDQDENGFASDNVQDALLEISSKNEPIADITVKTGQTRLHPDLKIAQGITVKVEAGGRLILI